MLACASSVFFFSACCLEGWWTAASGSLFMTVATLGLWNIACLACIVMFLLLGLLDVHEVDGWVDSRQMYGTESRKFSIRNLMTGVVVRYYA